MQTNLGRNSGMALLGLALLAGCTQGSSQVETSAALPRPQVVIVEDFAVWPARCSSTRA